jgi:hypothetical protein
VPEF